MSGAVRKFGSDTGNFNGGSNLTVKIPEGDSRYYVYDNNTQASGQTNDWDWGWGWKVWEGYRGATAAANKKMNIKMNMSSTIPHAYIFIEYLN